MTSGIYKITNLITNQIYIGSAADFIRRWTYHQSFLNRNKHFNRYLQRAWNKYGAENFEFSAIEAVAEENLIEREQYWIDTLNNCMAPIGYNLRPTANNNVGLKMSDETRAKMSASAKITVERLGRKKLDKWPHGAKCNCGGCKPLRNAELRAWLQKQREKKQASCQI